mmetsp:Transcript_53047/g.119319  ORF Transcript_53047/g.119319 Transcript_53047/m.119319 type:complete len:208 (-) Transcript_53047:8-631(-)
MKYLNALQHQAPLCSALALSSTICCTCTTFSENFMSTVPNVSSTGNASRMGSPSMRTRPSTYVNGAACCTAVNGAPRGKHVRASRHLFMAGLSLGDRPEESSPAKRPRKTATRHEASCNFSIIAIASTRLPSSKATSLALTGIFKALKCGATCSDCGGLQASRSQSWSDVHTSGTTQFDEGGKGNVGENAPAKAICLTIYRPVSSTT